MTDANALLMGTGVPATKPRVIGETVTIDPITNVEAMQCLDFKTRKPETYDDGSPKMQIVVTGQTTERDPTNPKDDGARKLYVKGQMRSAVREAVVEAGAQGLERGGALAVQWHGEKPPENPGMSPQKLFVAQYRRPAAGGAPAAAQSAPATNLFAPMSGADLIDA